ncbi:hypothetical protein Q0M94_23015 (plasmid) [Deinococcus radiomollis]
MKVIVLLSASVLQHLSDDRTIACACTLLKAIVLLGVTGLTK